jgi:hypothetical protein
MISEFYLALIPMKEEITHNPYTLGTMESYHIYQQWISYESRDKPSRDKRQSATQAFPRQNHCPHIALSDPNVHSVAW